MLDEDVTGAVVSRRAVVRAAMRGAAAMAAGGMVDVMTGLGGWDRSEAAPAGGSDGAAVRTGADVLAREQFGRLAGRRVGLITNQTGRANTGRGGDEHVADLLHAASGVRLTAILAPEHGFRGAVEAGAKVADDVDARTGVRVWSLYGMTRKPTRAMLADVDVLVFDIQDVGVRFYTYISTMGLAMQAAAERGIPFLVLDRPNPLGGLDVAGFVVEKALMSFVGQYPVPIVHGLTVAELARMIKAERWLDGLERLDLEVVPMEGWQRAMRWPATGVPWRPTSPNIPSFEAALVYPGMGLVGETLVNEGRGTPQPFGRFGAPWLDAGAAAARLESLRLPGVRFAAIRYTPRAIPGVAADPRFRGEDIPGVVLDITDTAAYRPLETGMHVLAILQRLAGARAEPLFGKRAMFHATAGTRRLDALLERGADGNAIAAAWAQEAGRFGRQRMPHLLYG